MGEPIEVCPLVGVAIVGVVLYGWYQSHRNMYVLRFCEGEEHGVVCIITYVHFCGAEGLGTAPSMWWPGDCNISCGGLGTPPSQAAGQNGFCVCVLVRLIKS